MRHLIIVLTAIALVSCNRDPSYLKQKYLDSGNKYYEQKRYKEARIMYLKALDKDRKFGAAWYHLALANLELQRVADAAPNLQRAYTLLRPGQPGYNEAQYNDTALKLSEIYLMTAQGQKEPERFLAEVRPMVDELLKQNPNSWEGHKLTGDMMLLATTASLKDAKQDEAKQNLTSAIREYRTAVAAKPGDYVLQLALGRSLALDGQTAEAEKIFKGLIDSNKINLNGYVELYRIYLSQKRLPEAETTLKSAIAAVPKDAQMRLMLAQFYYATKRQDDLLSLLNDMKKDLATFPEAYIKAGDFYMQVNQPDTAIKQYEDGIAKDPDHTTTYLKRQIEVYVRQGNGVMAQTKNEQILKLDPKDPEARGLKATFMLDKGQVNEALGDLQSVVTAKPGNFVARFNLGRAYFAKGQYEQARQEFDKCIELAPDYLPARYAQTQVAILRGDLDAAVRDADGILKIAPFSVQGRIMKAAALQRLNRYDEARKLLNEVLEKNPIQVETLLELGVLDLSQKNAKDALEHFRKAYEAAPQNIRGLLGESKALLMDGQLDKSVDLIREAALKKPSFELQRELGNAQMNARQYDSAVTTFQSLLNGTTDVKLRGDLFSRIGQCYRNKGDLPKSIESMEQAAKALPDNVGIAMNLALLYEAGNNLPKARTTYETAIRIEPGNPLALNNLAYLMTQTNGDLTQAMSYATQAKQRLPNYPEISDTIGMIYLKKNILPSAIDEFKQLVVQEPQNAIFHYHYAMALQQKGDNANAKAQCEAALANRPAKAVESEIQALESRLK